MEIDSCLYIFTGRQVNVVSPFLAHVSELLYVVLEYSSEPLFFSPEKLAALAEKIVILFWSL